MTEPKSIADLRAIRFSEGPRTKPPSMSNKPSPARLSKEPPASLVPSVRREEGRLL
jgi:hypothetical protein